MKTDNELESSDSKNVVVQNETLNEENVKLEELKFDNTCEVKSGLEVHCTQPDIDASDNSGVSLFLSEETATSTVFDEVFKQADQLEMCVHQIPKTVPRSAESPHISSVSENGVVLQWDLPDESDTTFITGYTIEQLEEGSDHWDTVTIQPVVERKYNICGLMRNHKYAFRIRAVNDLGTGEASTPTSLTEIKGSFKEPGQVKNLHVGSRDVSSVTLRWLKPEDDGGSKITGYFLEKCLEGDDEWEIVNEEENIPEVIKISDIVPGINYKFRVSACNEAGRSEWSEYLSVKENLELPSVDLVTKSKILTGEELVIDGSVQGFPSPHLTWFKNKEPLYAEDRWEEADTQNGVQISLPNCVRSDTGSYMLCAKNKVGEASDEVFINVLDKPGLCQKVVVKNISAKSCTLLWSAPEDNGGMIIEQYVVEVITKRSKKLFIYTHTLYPYIDRTTEGTEILNTICT